MTPLTSTPEIHQLDVVSIRESLLEWWSKHKVNYPWRRRIPMWQAIVAEIMLQRTKANQVVPVFSEFQHRTQNYPP